MRVMFAAMAIYSEQSSFRERSLVKHVLRAATVAALTVVAAIGFARPALAHPGVSGIDTTQGGSGVITFRVPSEWETASTTEVLVTLPDNTPILEVATQPKAGWTATLTKKNLPTPQKDDKGNQVTQYVSQVHWKADNPQAAIPPDQFDMFNIYAGPLPKQDSITLPVLQTYSDGHTANYSETAAPGQAEPDKPAPVLTLAAGSTEDNAATSHAAAPGGPTWPGIVALIIAIVAALLGLANLVLLRRKS
jgi:periplasmic copper chaperone A